MTTIQEVRAKAFAKAPYLMTALARLVLIAKPGIGTMAVSDKWQMFYDPSVIDRWGVDASGAVMEHEVWHLLRFHHKRKGSRDPKLWNVACDIAINDDEGLVARLPEGGIQWSMFHGVSSNMLEEDIYDVLVQQGAKQQGGRPGPGQGTGQGQGQGTEQGSGDAPPVPKDLSGKTHGDKPADGKCGSGAGGEKGAWEDDPNDPVGGGDSEIEEVMVADAVAQAVKSCGTVPSGVRRWANDRTAPPTVPWQQVLRVAIVRAMRMVPGATDYSYSRGRMRSGVLTPRLRRPVCPVAVVLDTSGSVSGPLLDAALAEVDGILKSTRCPCTVLACDAQVHGGAQRVTTASAVKPLGGGGTDMGVGIQAADSLVPRHGAIVVLTDGYTPWPKSPPRGPCIVALIGSSDSAAASIPAWATVVRVS